MNCIPKMTIPRSICVLCLAKGVKQQRLLGGNPILLLFLLFRFCFAINHSSGLWLDVVLCFIQYLCPVRPLGQLTVIVVLILLTDRNFCTQEYNFHNSQKRAFDLSLFASDWYTNFPGCPNFSEFLELHKYLRVTACYGLPCF